MGEECLWSSVYCRWQVWWKSCRCRRITRYLYLYDDESRQQGVQDRKACTQLSALLAYWQTGALLSAGQLVHPVYRSQRAHDGTEQDYQLEAGIYRNRPFRQVAGKLEWLELEPFSLLGNSASYLAQWRRRRTLYWFGRRTLQWNRKICCCRIYGRESL